MWFRKRARRSIQSVEINAPGQGRHFGIHDPVFLSGSRPAAVVSQLVTKFMEQNATVSRNNATITANFLGDELKQAKERMDTLRPRSPSLKPRTCRLPEQFQANVAQMQSHQLQLSNVNEALSRDQQQKLQLEPSFRTTTRS
jgi:hypothetical protein